MLDGLTALHESEHVYRGRYGVEDRARSIRRRASGDPHASGDRPEGALRQPDFTTRIKELKRAGERRRAAVSVRSLRTTDFQIRFRWERTTSRSGTTAASCTAPSGTTSGHGPVRPRGRRRGGRRRRLRPDRGDRRRPGRRGGPRPREAVAAVEQHRALGRHGARGRHPLPAGRRDRRGPGRDGGGHPPQERPRLRPGDDAAPLPSRRRARRVAGRRGGRRPHLVHDFLYPAHSDFRMHAPPSRTGAALLADLRRAVSAHPGPTVEARGRQALIADEAGAVRGVVAARVGRRPSGSARARCPRVERIRRRPRDAGPHCPEVAGAYYFGGEGNTGEAIRWGQALGGAIAFMDAYQGHASVAVPHGILITYALVTEGGIQVNRDGRASPTRPRATRSTR